MNSNITEQNTEQRIRWEERVHQANRLLREVCAENYPVTDIDVQVKNEMDRIRCRLDRIAFAIRYPAQAVKNKTLDT